jgi:hypothetical protein
MRDKDLKNRFASIVLGNLSILFALIGTASILLVDYRYVYTFTFVVYLILIIVEFSYGIVSPTSIVLFIIYAFLFVMSLLHMDKYGFYAGQMIYSMLFMVNLVSLLLKKPITLVYDKEGNGIYHFLLGYVWLAIFGISLVASIAFMPSEYFIIVPLALIFIGCLFNLYVNTFSFKHFLNIKTCSVNIKGREVFFGICNSSNSEHVEPVGKFINLEFNNNYNFMDYINQSKGFNIIYAYCLMDNQIKILASLIVNISDEIIISPTIKINLLGINKVLKVAHMDDLILDAQYRNSHDIIFRMFLYSLEICMMNGIDLMVTFCLKNKMELFKKIGFFKVTDYVVPKMGFSRKIHSDPSKPEYTPYQGLYPMVYNLSAAILKGNPNKDKNPAIYYNAMNKKILEAYFKTSFLKSLFIAWEKKPFNVSASHINDLFIKNGVFV